MGGDVLITVKAPYFNDPAPPGGLPGQAYFGLWDYEVELQTKVFEDSQLRKRLILALPH